MSKIIIPANNWHPRPYQMPAWAAWERGIKRSSIWWHRRAGKDEQSLHKTCVAMHPSPAAPHPNCRIGNYWHCLPQFDQARRAIWEAINPRTGKLRIDEAFPPALRNNTRNDMMSITMKSGSSWRIVGSDNPDSLVGATPVGIIFSEWALSNPSAWGLLQPMLLENGGWADFITTPRGKNHAYAMHRMAFKAKDWFAETLTIDDTGQVSLEQLESVRRDYVALYGEDAAEALIQQEYYCSAEAAILGAYYGKEMAQAEQEGRIREVKPWSGFPVHTAWDLGASRGHDSMAIWTFQIVPHETGRSRVLVLHFFSGSGMSIKHYAERINANRKRWQQEMCLIDHKAELPPGIDWVPHDARVPEMTSSGKDGKAKLRIEVMIECGLKPKVVINHHVTDGISAVRQILPRCIFDEEGTEPGREGLVNYQAEWDDDLKVFKKTPKPDWSAHRADAFRYLAVAFRELVVVPEPEKGRMLTLAPGTLPAGVKGVTLNDMWAKQSRKRRRL